ncbi:MAG: hypothetical protein KDI38_09305 [Calditrichaeota bacterium]|nr:hypothetical protein [Calditrichota bacterium]
MKITESIIKDLLPLYYAGEASTDTCSLVEAYLKEHPEFARQMEIEKEQAFPEISLPVNLTPEDEMNTLHHTQKLLRLRTLLMALAIFCSFLPFAFGKLSGDVDGVHWLWQGYPEGALMAGLIALLVWIGYYAVHRRLRVTQL